MAPSSSSSSDGHGHAAPRPGTGRVQVALPNADAAAEADAEVSGGYAESNEPNSTGAPSCGSGVVPNDSESIVAKTLEKLPPELAALAKDPKRHAKSKDPGWKYGFWPYEGKKDMVQCIFCKKVVPAGIKRFKQHIAGGYAVVERCPAAPAIVRKEMFDFLVKNARKELNLQQGREWDSESGGGVQEVPVVPSSGTRVKENKRKVQASIGSYMDPVKQGSQKYTKNVASMLCKSPEEVVSERHNSKSYQPSMEQCTQKSKESKQVVDDHVADFLYENGIPLNVVNSRSWEIMLESIGQYGPGYLSPSYHQLRNSLLERAVDKTNEVRKKHEEAWKKYGCTLMSDAWTDTRHRHLINFFVKSPVLVENEENEEDVDMEDEEDDFNEMQDDEDDEEDEDGGGGAAGAFRVDDALL